MISHTLTMLTERRSGDQSRFSHAYALRRQRRVAARPLQAQAAQLLAHRPDGSVLYMYCRKYEPWCGYGERPTGLTVLSGRV